MFGRSKKSCSTECRHGPRYRRPKTGYPLKDRDVERLGVLRCRPTGASEGLQIDLGVALLGRRHFLSLLTKI
jgi:hypothetical protein